MNDVDSHTSFLRLPAVQRRVPFSKSSIYSMMANGSFPASHRLGARAVGWLEHEVDSWVEARSTTPPAIPAAPLPKALKREERAKRATAARCKA
ncbi:MAG TPA: AlpA family phage regulatory protein [Edaphobacter sp.]|nr:AlpA family phage regulatory protein [Edaphobacter sp.]